MKNRKLFAIITLVAFMMTLLPMAAFAAANEFTTTIEADKEKVDANNDDTIKYTIFVYDNEYNIEKNVPVYFASSRATTDTFVKSGDWDIYTGSENVKYVMTDDNGKAEVEVKSLVAGTAKIGFALADEGADQTIYQYLIGNKDTKVSQIKFVKSFDATFEAASGQKVEVHEVKYRDRAEATSKTASTDADGVYYSPDSAWGKANGLDYFEVSVKVTNNNNAPAANKEVTINADKVDVTFDKNKATSDGSGIAKFKVYATKAGTYTLTYKSGSATAKELKVKFSPAEISNIVLKSDDGRTIAKDSTPNWKFEVRDSLGNKIDVNDDTVAESTIVTVDAIKEPSDASMKKSKFTITADTDNNWIKVKVTDPLTKVGDYKLRVTLSNGNFAEFSFTVKEQGEVVGLKLSYPQNVLPMNTKSGTPTVTWVDAAGVEKDATDTDFDGDGIRFAASDYNKITAEGIDPDTGVFTTTTNKDFVGDVVITAYDNANKLSSSFTLTITRELASMIVDAPIAKLEVGKTATIPVKFVDINGKEVAVGDVYSIKLTNAYAVSKPADSTVSLDTVTGFEKQMKEKGVSAFEVHSNKAGEAKLFANVEVVKNSGDAPKNYTATFTVNFGEPKQVVGAKNVTMFIGSTGYVKDGAAATMDQAPFIQDNRTFVPVRMVATALGATNEDTMWDPATQTITLVRPDMTVTMTVGSNVLTKSDGTTVVADVAPFIVAETGRTVIPFRAIAEAFGAEVEAVFGADGTVTAVTFQQ